MTSLPPLLDEETERGWMLKESGKNQIKRRRWFVLRGDVISYYKTKVGFCFLSLSLCLSVSLSLSLSLSVSVSLSLSLSVSVSVSLSLSAMTPIALLL